MEEVAVQLSVVCHSLTKRCIKATEDKDVSLAQGMGSE